MPPSTRRSASSRRSTLAINCLPMGVVFSSQCMTVATTSVREDMAVALVQTFGDRYEQIILVGDPLFMKRLIDHAAEHGVDWRRHRMHASSARRSSASTSAAMSRTASGSTPIGPEGGHIMSSFGVGELGLHLVLRDAGDHRAAARRRSANPAFARDLLGARRQRRAAAADDLRVQPAAHVHRGRRPGRHGYGKMTDLDARSGRADAAASLPDRRRRPAARRDEVRRRAAPHGVPVRDLPARCSRCRAATGRRCRTDRTSASTRTRSTPTASWRATSPARSA